jgi:hypothetical protein
MPLLNASVITLELPMWAATATESVNNAAKAGPSHFPEDFRICSFKPRSS